MYVHSVYNIFQKYLNILRWKQVIRERNGATGILLQAIAITIKYLFKLLDYGYPSVMMLINKI